MSRSPRGLLASLARLVVVAVLAVAVTVTVLPGGPADLVGLDAGTGTPEGAGDGAVTDGRQTTAETAALDRPSGPSPWGKEVLVVSVHNRADPSRDVAGAVAEALDYWNANGGYADYPARFVLDQDARDPDVVVWYNESIECADHADAIGCAPLLAADSRVDPPVPVKLRYDPADNRRQVRYTAIHELGHVLGRSHCEEPYWVMAPACDEPVPEAPDADQRDLAWLDGTISVHVAYGNVSSAEREETREQVGHALEYLEADPDGEMPADVEFVRVEDRFEADVSVTFLAEQDCQERAAVCFGRAGRDYDGDGRMEYYSNADVHIAPAVDVEARGWYVGRTLAVLLSPANVPGVFAEDAGYRERRSRWWE